MMIASGCATTLYIRETACQSKLQRLQDKIDRLQSRIRVMNRYMQATSTTTKKQHTIQRPLLLKSFRSKN